METCMTKFIGGLWAPILANIFIGCHKNRGSRDYNYCCVKIDSGGNVYCQAIKLGTQSKLYEQNYSQMILAI